MLSAAATVEIFPGDEVNYWIFSPPFPNDCSGKLELSKGLCFPETDAGCSESVNCHRLMNDVHNDTNRLATHKLELDKKVKLRALDYEGYVVAIVSNILAINVSGTHFTIKHNPFEAHPPHAANYAHCDLELISSGKAAKRAAKSLLSDCFSALVAYEEGSHS